MQNSNRISLNAVRIFNAVASTGSISQAAEVLNVTPGAVSHQIKNLEDALGVSLFVRLNNSINLNAVGSNFYDDTKAGVQIIEQAIDDLDRDANEISLLVALSFAVRWLIPALEDFKQQFPSTKVKVETFNHQVFTDNMDADMGIVYKRVMSEVDHESILLRDFCRPVISPNLLSELGFKSKQDISTIPAISCTNDNWDWHYWEEKTDFKHGTINFAHKFDSDDAAIHAAVAGLGMVLATPLSIRKELKIGNLVELPLFDPVLTGYYCVVPGRRKTAMIEQFKTWLSQSLKGLE